MDPAQEPLGEALEDRLRRIRDGTFCLRTRQDFEGSPCLVLEARGKGATLVYTLLVVHKLISHPPEAPKAVSA